MNLKSKIRLNVTGNGDITIIREDGKYSIHDPLHSSGDQTPIEYGQGGDCRSWAKCSEARTGEFSIHLPGNTQSQSYYTV